MEITKDYLTPNKYSRPGIKLEQVTKVAVHYTGNPGSTAKNNRDYFESLKNGGDKYVSSHYVIGLNGEIIQCIPENEWSYCTNQANGYSISIECCHKDSTGKFNDETEKSLVELAADICKRYSLNPQTDMLRHYDVTRKICPKWYVDHPEDWEKVKEKVKEMSEQNGYWVRIGLFSEKSRAKEIAEEVSHIGFYNYVKEVEGKWAVEVGSFSEKAKADALVSLLRQELYSYVL